MIRDDRTKSGCWREMARLAALAFRGGRYNAQLNIRCRSGGQRTLPAPPGRYITGVPRIALVEPGAAWLFNVELTILNAAIGAIIPRRGG